MEITQFVWQHREIPRELGCMIILLIPKGNTDNKGIGLLEFLWKVVEEIVDTLLRESVCLIDIREGNRDGDLGD